MRIVFVSNYWTHHQKPLCDALDTLTDFAFLQTEVMPPERLALGWQPEQPDYVTENCHVLADADVVIAGSAPEKLIRPCIRRGIPVFRYHERPLKKGQKIWKYIPRWLKWHWQNPTHANIWLLCAGSEVAADYARFGLFRDRALKWGYFPETDPPGAKQRNTILWAGRLIDWKHPDAAIRLAEHLMRHGYDFHLEILGTGPMLQALQQQIDMAGLRNRVTLVGAVSPAEVRQRMAQSEIFLFTSDRQEGWGAVLNEAMGCGCAVVASTAAGATGFLVEPAYNGLTFQTEAELYRHVKTLLEDKTRCSALGNAAQQTIGALWNGEVAAQRFVAVSRQICTGQIPQLWEKGPCSKG